MTRLFAMLLLATATTFSLAQNGPDGSPAGGPISDSSPIVVARPTALTNDSIVKMVKADLGDALILQTINALSAQISGLNAQTCVVTAASPAIENLWPFDTNTSTTGNYVPPITTNGPLNNGLLKSEVSMIFSCHDVQFVESLANRVIELSGTSTYDLRMSYSEYLADV